MKRLFLACLFILSSQTSFADLVSDQCVSEGRKYLNKSIGPGEGIQRLPQGKSLEIFEFVRVMNTSNSIRMNEIARLEKGSAADKKKAAALTGLPQSDLAVSLGSACDRLNISMDGVFSVEQEIGSGSGDTEYYQNLEKAKKQKGQK